MKTVRRSRSANRIIAAALALALAAEPIGSYLPTGIFAYAEEAEATETSPGETPAAAAPEQNGGEAAGSTATQNSVATSDSSAASTVPAAPAEQTAQDTAKEVLRKDAANTDSATVGNDVSETGTGAAAENAAVYNKEETDTAGTDGGNRTSGTESIHVDDTSADTAAGTDADSVNQEEEGSSALSEEGASLTDDTNGIEPVEEPTIDSENNAAEADDSEADHAEAKVGASENSIAEDTEKTEEAAEPADTAEPENTAETETAHDFSTLSLEELDALAQETVAEEETPRLMTVSSAPEVSLLSATPVTLAASSSDAGSVPVLQNEINKALAALTTLSGKVSIVLNRNVSYEGDITINAGDRAVADDFALELSAEDAGSSGIEGDGATTINGNITIQGVKVIMNSVMMASGKWITVKNAGASTPNSDDSKRGGSLEYNGTRNMMNDVSVKVGSNSSAKIITSDNDDTINVEAEGGAKSVLIDSGEGLSFINATVYGGDLEIKTGSGTDSVTLDVEEGAESVKVSTGDSYDEVSIISNGAPATFEVDTGDGDDVITLDMRAKSGNVTVHTGKGGDTLSILKGDHYSIETLDYAESKVLAEDKTFNSPSVLTIVNEDEDAVNRATVDVAVGDAIKGIVFTGGKGASVHLKGSLLAGTDEGYNPIRKNGNTLTFTVGRDGGEDYTLEITGDAGTTNYTDALVGKRTVYLDITDAKLDPLAPSASETAKDSEDTGTPGDQPDKASTGTRYLFDQITDEFTNYVLRMPVRSDLGSLRFTGSDKPLLLTNIVIDTDETLDEEEKLEINRLIAENVNVLLKGETIDINGTVIAQNVRAEAVRGSHLFSELLQRVLAGDLDGGMDAFSMANSVNINFNSGANVRAANDIAALARVKHAGGILTVLPASVNFLNIKIADAHVTVKDGARLIAGQGSVDLQAKIDTTTGYEFDYNDDGSVKKQSTDGMPLASTFIFDNASVIVENGSFVKAAEDVLLRSDVTVKTLTYADTGVLDGLSLSFGAAMGITVISNTVNTTVAGHVIAGREVFLGATGSVTDDTKATKTSKSNSVSGAYIAVNVVDQDVAATVKDTAQVLAKRGDVIIRSIALADVKTSAIAGTGKQVESTGAPSVGGAAWNLLKGSAKGSFKYTLLKLWNLAWTDHLKPWLESTSWGAGIADKSRMKKLDKLMNSFVGKDYSAKVIEPDKENAKKGSATVSTEEVENDHNEDLQVVKATVTVTPVAGCTVKMVQYRYMKPDEMEYTWARVEKDEDGNYTFNMPSADVEVVVTWDGEPAGGDNPQNNGNNQEENDNDTIDLSNLFDQADELTNSDADEEEALYTLSLTPGEAHPERMATRRKMLISRRRARPERAQVPEQPALPTIRRSFCGFP